MKLKEIKDSSEKLSFFVKFVDISKIRVLQLLNQELRKLNNIQKLKTSNLNLINEIEEQWFVKKGFSFFDREDLKVKKNQRTIYFLIDPPKIDFLAINMLKKLEETLIKKVTPDDFVVTFGNNVNLICQKNEFNVIEHFDYSVFEDMEDFSKKTSALVEIGVKNNLFHEAVMLIVQYSNSNSDPIVRKQILPFAMNETTKDVSNIENENEDSKVNDNLGNHNKIISSINLKKSEWNPDIYVIHEQLAKTIVMQGIYELKIISNIEAYNLELQLLEENKNKLVEQQNELQFLYNRARKEDMTMQSLLLYAAFKLKDEEEEFPLFKIKGVVK